MKKNITLVLCSITMTVGCGGGGSSANPTVIEPVVVNSNIVTSDLFRQTVRGVSCDLFNSDISDVAKFKLFQLGNIQSYHCLQAHKSDGHPTKSGDYAYRFELRPEDCTWNTSHNDCINDRSRTEIEDDSGGINVYNKEIVWDFWMYIPKQPRFKPVGSGHLFVSQLLTMSTTGCCLNYFGFAQILISSENKLAVRPLNEFSFTSAADIHSTVDINAIDNPYNQWINIRYEIKTSMYNDGYSRVKINGNTILNATGPNVLDKDLRVMLRLGLYNGSKSKATEPYNTQVIYYDSITKSIK
jgi:hypothetical protein